MRLLSKTILPFVLLLLASPFLAQQTAIEGRVLDASTLEPIAFANVYLPGHPIGTTTDLEGFFRLNIAVEADSLAVSSLGYQSQSKALARGTFQGLQFNLQPLSLALSEVRITPGENPAHAILRKVWANKAHNNPDRLPQFSVDAYSKTKVFLRSMGREEAEGEPGNQVFRRFGLQADSASVSLLPVFMSETLATEHFLRSPQRSKTELKATQTRSLADADADVVTQLIQKSSNFNFYSNHVRIFDRNFVSPLSTSGLFYYKYYLVDSLYLDEHYAYELRVVPRRAGDLVFSGTVWVNDSTFALKRLSLELGKEANLNFVDRIRLQQDFKPVEGGVWYPSGTRVLADAVNIFVHTGIVYNNFNISHHEVGFFDRSLSLPKAERDGDLGDWDQLRPVPLDTMDLAVLERIDGMRDVGRIRFLAGLVNMSVKGYYNLGAWELGPYLLFYNFNEVEGHRFRLGFKSNQNWSRDWMVQGHLAYGSYDKDFKYGLKLERFLHRESWTRAGLQLMHDVERLGAEDDFLSEGLYSSFAHSFGGTNRLSRVKLGRLWLESDLFRGFTQQLSLKLKQHQALGADFNFAYYTDDSRSQTRSDLQIAELGLSWRYRPGATFLSDKNERFPVAFNNAPTVRGAYDMGLEGWAGGAFHYQRWSLGVEQQILLGSLGSVSYDLGFTKIHGQLPWPLLTVLPANESFFRTEKTFNMMRYGEFVADESATLFLTFRQDGFILDKIPLIKRLRLRTVAGLGVAAGRLANDSNGFYDALSNPEGLLPAFNAEGEAYSGFQVLDWERPYVEASYGIENILQLFRVEAFHRLSYLDVRETGALPASFGLKVSAVFRF